MAHNEEALDVFRELGDRHGTAQALYNLGSVHWELGVHGQARQHHEQAIAMFRELGDHQGEAHALNNLGHVHHSGDRNGEAYARKSLGCALLGLGSHGAALTQLKQALTLARQTR